MQADPKKIKHILSIVKGQLEGLNKMIDEDAYCIDISDQLLASIALLKKANNQVIAAHLRSCVMNSKSDEDKEKKLIELENTLKRISNE